MTEGEKKTAPPIAAQGMQKKRNKGITIYLVPQHIGNSRCWYLKFGESKHLPIQVLQRGSDMIHIYAVDNQKAVVVPLADMNSYRRILKVVPFHVKPKLTAYSLCIDVGFHPIIPIAQHQQYRFIHIIVNEQDGFLCRQQQLLQILRQLEYLPIPLKALLTRLPIILMSRENNSANCCLLSLTAILSSYMRQRITLYNKTKVCCYHRAFTYAFRISDTAEYSYSR